MRLAAIEPLLQIVQVAVAGREQNVLVVQIGHAVVFHFYNYLVQTQTAQILLLKPELVLQLRGPLCINSTSCISIVNAILFWRLVIGPGLGNSCDRQEIVRERVPGACQQSPTVTAFEARYVEMSFAPS